MYVFGKWKLFRTEIDCYVCYDSKTKGFVGMSELGVPVAGVKVDKNRLIVCDGVETIDIVETALKMEELWF